MHNKPRATHDTRTYKSVQRKTNYKKKKKWQEYVKGTQNLLKELPMSKPGLI